MYKEYHPDILLSPYIETYWFSNDSIQGDYKQVMDASNEVYYYLLNDLKIETYNGIGIFHDNPKEVAKEKLRSEVGCVIEPKDIARLNESGCKYKMKTLPVETSVVVEFPFKNNFDKKIKQFLRKQSFLSVAVPPPAGVRHSYMIDNVLIRRQRLRKRM